MSVGSVLISLQASNQDGRGVTSDEFVAPWNIETNEVVSTYADGGAWTSGSICIAIVRLSGYSHIDDTIDAGAPNEAFIAGIINAFRKTGDFLNNRSTELIDKMRSSGLKLQIFIDVRMDDDQMEIEFPPEFLSACGRHKLSVCLISNDISAGEILAAQNS